MRAPAGTIRRRAVLVPLVLGVHVLIGAALLRQGAAAAPDAPPPALLVSAVALPERVVASVPPPSDVAIATDAPLPVFEVAAAVPGTGCAIDDEVRAALHADPAAQAALARIPADARSRADAVMLWRAGWAAADLLGGAAVLEPIRAAVEGAVRAAPAACRDADVVGPRLVLVQAGGLTLPLVFGSGHWQWSTVLDKTNLS